MSRLTALSTAAAAMLISMSAHATILPDNNLYLQDRIGRRTGITQAQFESIIGRARTLYGSLVSGNGGRLDIRGRWDDSTVNANATQLFGTWTVNMYGGLARRPEITPDGFTLVLCHEIGHHMGGFPFVSEWAANEGQADYFATHDCAQLFWGDDLAGNAAAASTVNAVAKAKCDAVWNTEASQNLCYRTMNGSQSLANLLAALKNQTVDFSTPDTSEVATTNDNHPDAQCRLDTYAAGATCTAEYDPQTIPGKREGRGRNDRQAEEASASFSCTASDQYQAGLRPRCWFKPTL